MVGSTPLIGEAPAQGKVGHQVLCCCDSRKAVIILGLGAMALNVAHLISLAVPSDNVENLVWMSYAIPTASILFYMLVIGSALRYHCCAITICLIWEIVSLILFIVACALANWGALVGKEKTCLIVLIVVEVLIKSFRIYVFSTFLHEVNSGIMSLATHSCEKYSCCCNV
jgi:hypothetical protein